MSTPVAIKLYDLISAARSGKLRDVTGRDGELTRLARILLRPQHHNVALIADPGSGKTSLVEALAVRLSQGDYAPLEAKLYRLSTEPIMGLLVNGDSLRQTLAALKQATQQLTSATIVIEDIQLLASDDPGRLELTLALFESLASHSKIRLVITTTTTAYYRTFRDNYVFARTFDALELPEPTTGSVIKMVEQAAPSLELQNNQVISDEAIEAAVRYGGRFGHGRALPDAAIRLLEETCVKATQDNQDYVIAQDVMAVVSERERLPLGDLMSEGTEKLAQLEPQLRSMVIGQDSAISTIARTVAKSQLGLGDSSRPRGSFLLLGPSGVGKTQTAKALAEVVYSSPAALVRLDMSEYSEAHSAVRLIGSPPGYVGYEEGGQLTGAVAREPYSLVLLDEIEKAHSKLFDLFLQLLDDGRLTDSAGKTVDFTETLILATSNTGSAQISEAHSQGVDINSTDYMQQTLLPLLMKSFRPEFINRFDAILVYSPLGEAQLVALAQLELSKLQQRMSRLGITFDVSDSTLATMLRPTLNPLFGARPVKRLISSRFETPLADRLIKQRLDGPMVITGEEAWLKEGVAQ